jgi:hypothetical protein
MGSGGLSGRAFCAQGLSRYYMLTSRHGTTLHVSVSAEVSIAVVDDNIVAIATIPTTENDGSTSRGAFGGPRGRGEIHARVAGAPAIVLSDDGAGQRINGSRGTRGCCLRDATCPSGALGLREAYGFGRPLARRRRHARRRIAE